MIRTVSAIAAVVLWLAGSPAAAERELRFRVAVDGAHVGEHTFRLVRDGEHRRVESEARITVKFLLFDAYRYIHFARERWRGDCLESISSRTNDNGETVAVRGERTQNRFVLETDEARRELPPCVMSFAYWNPAMLRQPRLLNAHTGEYVPVEVLPLGSDTIEVRGEPTLTHRYALRTPNHRMDLWYSSAGRWVRLEIMTPEGKRVSYSLQQPGKNRSSHE